MRHIEPNDYTGSKHALVQYVNDVLNTSLKGTRYSIRFGHG